MKAILTHSKDQPRERLLPEGGVVAVGLVLAVVLTVRVVSERAEDDRIVQAAAAASTASGALSVADAEVEP